MRRQDFHFELPPKLIAQYPLPQRGASRLMCLDGRTGRYRDRAFAELPELLCSGDLLVFNDTRVIRARLFGRKETGGRVEVLVERVLDERRALAHVRASKSPKPGQRLLLEEAVTVTILARQGELFELAFEDRRSVLELLESHGHVPLPPYISRPDVAVDAERYQTVFARRAGAVAAPTAGLHFDTAMLGRLDAAGVSRTFITLHVGAGTFQPMRAERIEDHRMHAEHIEVAEQVCARVREARAQGGRVVAVGTTSVRALESASLHGAIAPFSGETNIFIHPGFRFRAVDLMITNFHLPESTLLMLVCAFAGYDHVMRAYRHAVEAGYRFFSYGDAMLVTRQG